MSPEDSHKPIRIYIGGLILGVNTLYMLFCFFKLFAVVGNELRLTAQQHYHRLLCSVVYTINIPYPVATSHILMVLSREEESRKSPEGIKHTEETLWSWPCSVLMHSYVVRSHRRTDMSAEQEATRNGVSVWGGESICTFWDTKWLTEQATCITLWPMACHLT